MTKQAITQEELFVPLLWFIADRDGEIERQRDKPFEALADELALTDEERDRKTEKTGRDQWTSIVENCRRKLVARGLIAAGTPPGVWRLSEEGRRQAENPPQDMIEKLEGWLATRDTKPLQQSVSRVESLSARPRSERVEPEEEEGADEILPGDEVRESTLIQGQLAEIGATMGMRVWLPKNDRSRVLQNAECPTLVDSLPMSFEQTVLRTVSQIDVLWLSEYAVLRAFEVEHTTAVYSGLLRMADLLALQHNLRINLHIVAPARRRKKVTREVQRPVFQQLRTGPLAESCSFISYEAVNDLANDENLAYLPDSVLDRYEDRLG